MVQAPANAGLYRSLLAIAMAVVLIFSVAESFACSLEDAQQSGMSFALGGDAPSGDAPFDDICVHGHCHHGAIAIPSSAISVLLRNGTEMRMSLHSVPALSHIGATLERPPKHS